MNFPENPAGDRVRSLLARLKESEVTEAEVGEWFAPSFLEAIPPERVVPFLGRIKFLATAPVEEVADRSSCAFAAALRVGEDRYVLRVAVEEEVPHRFTLFGVRAGPSLLDILDQTVGAPASFADAIDQSFKDLVTRMPAGGAVVAAVGLRDVEVAAYGDVRPDSVLEIGSITKVFTGALLADLALGGAVSFDDDVDRYLPSDVSLPRTDSRPITLVDLATHSSGLPRLPPGFAPGDPSNPYADFDEAALLESLRHVELETAVGRRFAYSNLGFGLLGYALGRAAGASLSEILHDRLLGPLGMGETGTDLRSVKRVTGHAADGVVASRWDVTDAMLGAGGLESSIADMITFARAHLDMSASVLGESLRGALEPRFDDDDRHKIGLGWNILARSNGSAVHMKNGGTGGFRSAIALDVGAGYAVVALCSCTGVNPDQAVVATLNRLAVLDQ